MEQLPKGHPKLLSAWAFYDWANSVYSLVIASAIFPIFYGALTIVRDSEGNKISDSVVFLGTSFNNDALISYVTSISFLVVAIISPFLSGISDYIGNKKAFLRFFCFLGAISCIGLYWFSLENLLFGIICYMLALIGFWGSLVFYNSYLPDIVEKEGQDNLSARGYISGYFGSVILLIMCLILIMKHDFFGFPDEGIPTRISFVMVGLWWIGFSQYSLYFLPKGNKIKRVPKDVLFNGFRELKKVYHQLLENEYLKRYLLAFFVYSMAVQTVMIVATYFGMEEIDWSGQSATTGLIVSILLIQLVAAGGAKLTALSSKKFGNITTLLILNILWAMVCFYAFFMTKPFQFYIAASCVGLVMGGIQSLSRSTYSKLLPQTEDTASFFSFYDVTEKIGIVIGMFMYGYISQITGSMRNAILFLISFFVIGIILLLRIPNSLRKLS
ncbi:MAG: MFS transporter [Bacteroidetes bacterium HGW-Bacteroidetes-13]|nr:MAG: MFS transporter [Bacteroidetes bacterium HGW-Bacteroidetes-13]